MYQCTVCFFAGPTMEAFLHHECPGLGLIGKYLVMSNSNKLIIQRFIFTAIFLLTRFSRHLLSSDAFSLDFSRSPSPYSETMTSNKLTNWEDRNVSSLRRKRFRAVSEQGKTEERDSLFWPRENVARSLTLETARKRLLRRL